MSDRGPCGSCGHPHDSGVRCEVDCEAGDGYAAGPCGCAAEDMPQGGPVQPQIGLTLAVDGDTTLIPTVFPQVSGVTIGSQAILMFRNLPALARFANNLIDLAQAWNDALPDDHPLRSFQPKDYIPSEENPSGVNSADTEYLSKLLDGVDLSGLEGQSPTAS